MLIESRFETCKKTVIEQTALKNALVEQIEQNEKLLETLTVRGEKLLIAQKIIQEAAEFTQKQIQAKITSLGTMLLQAVFGNEYELLMEFPVRRGKVEIDFFVQTEKGIVSPTDCGGGLIDVLSFALRLPFLALSAVDRTLILDEPFKFVSRDKVVIIYELLKELAEQYELQMLIVTHDPGIMEIADNTITVE